MFSFSAPYVRSRGTEQPQLNGPLMILSKRKKKILSTYTQHTYFGWVAERAERKVIAYEMCMIKKKKSFSVKRVAKKIYRRMNVKHSTYLTLILYKFYSHIFLTSSKSEIFKWDILLREWNYIESSNQKRTEEGISRDFFRARISSGGETGETRRRTTDAASAAEEKYFTFYSQPKHFDTRKRFAKFTTKRNWATR